MSIYETIWKNDKHRTLLISGIVAIASLILAILFASYGKENTPIWLEWLYQPEEFRIGLTILEIILLALLYFHLLMFLATFMELKAALPSWGTIGFSAVFTLLFTWLVVMIKPYEATDVTNFTPAMIWTIYGSLVFLMILSVVYLFYTTPEKKS